MTLNELLTKRARSGMTFITDIDGVHTRRDRGVRLSIRNERLDRCFVLEDGIQTLELQPKDDRVVFTMVVGAYESQEVVEFYQFHTPDGQGVQNLLRQGIRVIVVSGRNAAPVKYRFGKTLFYQSEEDGEVIRPEVYLGIKDKLEHFTNEVPLNFSQSIFIGDGAQDAPLLQKIKEAGGVAVATADAESEAIDAAEAQTRAEGGEGAFAELANAYIAHLSE